MADGEIEVAQSAPRPKQTRPRPERPDGDGDRDRRPPAKGQQPAPKGRDKDQEPVLPPNLSIGAGMGLSSLDMREADPNSIKPPLSRHAIVKGPNQIT